jgi:hypothetical protein
MEYFLGSLITFLTIFAAGKILRSKEKTLRTSDFLYYSQSYSHELVKPFLPTNAELSRLSSKPSQSEIHDQKQKIRVIMMKNKAYWIKNNAFYNAEIQDGEILKETTTQVDIMGMDRVQLEEMVFIVEELTRGLKNDSGNTGQQKL